LFIRNYIHRNKERDETNFLDVDTSLAAKKPDIYNVVTTHQSTLNAPPSAVNQQLTSRTPAAVQCDSNSDDFIDDPDVPPLI